MKKIFTILAILPLVSIGQLNVIQLGYLDYQALRGSGTSNLWGYTDEVGNEYAVVGINAGVSIVDVTNPASPNEVFFQAGTNSIWREVKTFGDYAYITTEASDGLMIIDLGPLPGSTALPVTFFNGPSGNPFVKAHSLFIDENGILYLHGTDRGNGGVILYDLNSSPTNPTEIGVFDNWYVHDSYARGDTLYSAHIYDGFFSITNVSTPSSISLMASNTNTPMNFVHNCWLSGNGKYLFTTDEKSGAWIGAFDISDFSNIKEVDRIRKSETSGTIPHNTYWLNNYLVTSYYRDGITIHDVTDPSNMIEVGNFDTTPLSGDGFNGAWGVYPFFASGNLIVTDIELGLFILGPTYVRACYVQGNITDAVSTLPINTAQVDVLTTANFDQSDLVGFYSTGVSTPGSYQLIYSKAGYYSDTITVNFVAGIVDTVNVALVPMPIASLTGTITDAVSASGINNAQVVIQNSIYNYTTTTNASGNFTISPFSVDYANDTFDITIGLWGYVTYCATAVVINDTTGAINVSLQPGFYDDFLLDFGWTVNSTATAGFWVRDEPFGTISGATQSNPEYDISYDCFDKCYVTGNANSSGAGTDDIDNGNTILTSPVFNTTGFSDPYLSFYLWFANSGGVGIPNDTVTLYLNNGADIRMDRKNLSNYPAAVWNAVSYRIADFTSVTSGLSLKIKAQDYTPGNVTEAGVDYFRITEGNPFLSVSSKEVSLSPVLIYPNPTSNVFNLISKTMILKLDVMDISGKIILSKNSFSNQTTIDASLLEKGIYFIRVIGENDRVEVVKVIKQ